MVFFQHHERNKHPMKPKKFSPTCKECTIPAKFSRQLSKDARELPYQLLDSKKAVSLHLGQRKLLLSEIEFLTTHGHKADLVVYAGAADGKHISILMRFFPDHTFHLYDSQAFHLNLIKLEQKNTNLTLFKRYFTNQDARNYKDRSTLFISDIRTVGLKESMEYIVPVDMENQKNWYLLMEPQAAILKFRLPYMPIGTKETKQIPYLDGDIFLQPWMPIYSCESRLVVTKNRMCHYDARKYESQMFHHNVCTRVQSYTHDIPINRVVGLDYCYDCTAEITILQNYLLTVRKVPKTQLTTQVIKFIKAISRDLGRSLLQPLHGLGANIPLD